VEQKKKRKKKNGFGGGKQNLKEERGKTNKGVANIGGEKVDALDTRGRGGRWADVFFARGGGRSP